MAVASIPRSTLGLRPAVESRPPAQTWLPQLAEGASGSQPMLDFEGEPRVQASTGAAWMARSVRGVAGPEDLEYLSRASPDRDPAGPATHRTPQSLG